MLVFLGRILLERGTRLTVERNALFDYAKGIGILLVVYGHVARGLIGAGLAMDKAAYGLIDSVIYSFHMPLFFIPAGLLFPGSIARHSRRSLIENKFRLIFYPYVVWSLIQGAIEVEFTGATNSRVTWGQVLSFLWQPRDQFWFLYILFVIFVVSAILYRRTNIYWSTIIVFIAAMLFMFKIPPLDFYVVNIFRACFVFFAVGVSARILWPPDPERQARPVLMLWLSAMLFGGSQYLLHGPFGLDAYNGEPVVRLMLALSGSAFVIALSHFLLRFDRRWLSYLGRHSIEIYLVHIIAASGIRIILQKFLGITDVGIQLVSGMIAGVGAPSLLAALAPKFGFNWLFAAPSRRQLAEVAH